MELTAAAPKPAMARAVPVAQKDRITILDSLRGFAILGILLMNMPGFAYPAGGDPTILNETGINYDAWYTVRMIFAGTQRALFSMLFGAGIILFVSSAEKKTPGLMPADYFFRRQLWLIVFSLVDVFLLMWYGDILLDYALLGLIMFTFRKMSPKKLLLGAGFCLLFMLARENRDFYELKATIVKGERVVAIDTTVTKLNELQKADLNAMLTLKKKHTPEGKKEYYEKKKRINSEGTYAELYKFRTNEYLDTLVHYLFFELWDVLLCMFLGMAFFKMGILTGHASTKIYAAICIIGLSVGIFLALQNMQPFFKYNFNSYEVAKNTHFQFYQLERIFRSMGIFGLIMLMYKSGIFKWLFSLLQPVGQMAFTNYLSQSLICGMIFYSIGFGLYGKLERIEIYYVMAAVWIFQIIVSHIWLRYYRFGPLEWLWRSLTYWKLQPMKKH